MNPEEQNRWKSAVLDTIFEAMASRETLTDLLIYKGARVLNRRLKSLGRQSLDIDSNLAVDAIAGLEREEIAPLLEREVKNALNGYFEAQNPVRYQLGSVRVRTRPGARRPHPHGWDAFEVTLLVRDLRRSSVLGLPGIRIDVAAPETLLEDSAEPLEVGEYEVMAYSLPRLAGEKLRAFLSSLPEYRLKMKKPGEGVRAKDVYDIGRIAEEHPLSDTMFWQKVGAEFRTACESRFIDCEGLATFEQELAVTRHTYQNDPTIPGREVPFEEAWTSLAGAVRLFEEWEFIPFRFPVPDGED